MQNKTCTKCAIEQDSVNFASDKHSKTGLRSWCKWCVKRYQIENRRKINEGKKLWRRCYAEKPKPPPTNRKKICSYCKKDKTQGDFHRDKYTSDGLASRCKDCVRQYQEKNKERIRAYQRKWDELYRKHGKIRAAGA